MSRSKIYLLKECSGYFEKKASTLCRLIFVFSTAILLNSETRAQVAPVSPPNGQFKIDGALRANVTTKFGDWIPRLNSQGFTAGLDSFVLNNAGSPEDPNTTGLSRDLFNSNSDSVFANGSKFEDSIPALRWGTGSAPSKNDINNALYHVSTNPSGGDQWTFIAGDRLSTSGTSYIDFEFLQGTLTVNPNGTFTGSGPAGGRTVNDINVSMEYTNGGSKPNVIIYRWKPKAGGGYFWDSTGSAGYSANGTAFAETNRSGAVDVPFQAFNNTTYSQYAFVEAAVNITRLVSSGGNCQGLTIKTLWIKTKAAASSTAALKDFMKPIPVNFNFGDVNLNPVSPLCVNADPVTLTADPAGGAFSGNGVSGNQFNPTLAGVAGSPHRIIYEVSLGLGCAKRDTIYITVNPLPTASISGGTTICKDAPAPYVVLTGASGTRPYTFTYTINNGSPLTKTTTGSFDTVKLAVPTGTSGTFTYALTNVADANSCTATASGSVNVVVNPVPTVSKPADQVKCNNTSTDAITFSGTNATSYTWTNDNINIGLAASGTGDISSFTATNSGNSAITANITVTPHYTGGSVTCDGTPQIFSITVNPTPTVNDPADQVKCNTASTNTVTFSGNATTYLWSNDNTTIGLGASGSGTSIPSFTAVNTGTTAVVATITVTPRFTGGGINCDGTSQTFTITVNPTPSVTKPSDQIKCNNTATNAINFSGSGATSFRWTNDNTTIGLAASGTGDISSFTAVNNGTTAQVANITVTPRFTGGSVDCDGTPKTFSITVNPTPSVNDPADQTLCNGASTATVSFSGGVSGTTYNWSNNTTSIGLGASGTGDISSFTTTNNTASPVTATITVTPTANSCPGPQQSFTITVNNVPGAPTICMIQPSLCGPSTGSIKVISPLVAGYQYSKDNGSTWQDCNVFLGLAAGSNPVIRYRTSSNSTGCISASATCVNASICSEQPVACQGGNFSSRMAPNDVKVEESSMQVTAYPNPFNDRISFVVNAPAAGKGSLEVYNTLGQKIKTVYQGSFTKGSQKFDLRLPLRQQQNLIYVLTVGGKQVTGKILQLNR